MGEEIDPQVEQFSDRVSAGRMDRWLLTPEAWRLAGRLGPRWINAGLRVRSGNGIPNSLKARFTALGLPADIVDETLGQIHSLNGWADAWIETAQRFLGDFRRQSSGEGGVGADEARRLAALCYHIAQILSFEDERTKTLCRASTSSLFAQAQPRLFPYAHRVRLPWRTSELPAYYMVPESREERIGLVVLLNGASMAKEETFAWSHAYIQRGLGVIVIDSPGTGEATSVAPYSAEQVDILDGVFDLVAEQPNIDPRRVAVLGISLGANQAMRAMAYDRRILAGIAISPTYDPARWINHASPVLRSEIHALVQHEGPDLREVSASFDLKPVVPRIRRPVLVYGGARDVVTPPNEAQLLAAQLGRLGTLIWHPTGAHCLYDRIPEWTRESAEWLDAIGRARVGADGAAQIDDPYRLAEIGRAVFTREVAPLMEPDDDELGDYARLVTPSGSA